MFRNHRRLALENLDVRRLLTADLAVQTAFLADLDANPVSEIVEGERVLVRVNYTTTDLTNSDEFVIRFELDGRPIESEAIQGLPGNGLQFYRYYYIGYAGPGLRQVRVVLDANDQINESNENNNQFAFDFTPVEPDLPQKFRMPYEGEQSEHWTIINLHDVDLRTGFREDFSGGFLQYDNHAAWDFFLPNFEAMDEGTPVVAAMDGIVVETDDGHFDREDFWDFTLPDPRLANFVILDHGNGWKSFYYHLQRNTVTVEPGDRVVAGQALGMAASSGISDGPHIHFGILHNNVPVEPMYVLDKYFVDPPTYLGDQLPQATRSGITNSNPIPDFHEAPNDVREFQLNGGVNPWLWFRFEFIRRGDVMRTEWRRPDGSLHFGDNWTSPEDIRYQRFWAWSSAITALGEWSVTTFHNGREVAHETFEVVAAASQPELDVRNNDTYIINGRTTPIDLGESPVGMQAQEQVFTISNRGQGPLNLSNLELPHGFELVGTFPTFIPAGASRELRIRLDTTSTNHYWGDLSFRTNDRDESLFRFGIEGTVTGGHNPDAPQLLGPTTARPIEFSVPSRSVFDGLLLADPDSSTFGGTRLRARIASGWARDGSDGLYVLPTSNIQLQQNTILFQGAPVATLESIEGGHELEILITAEVSHLVVQEVAAAVAFWQQRDTPDKRRRIIELQVIDADGNASPSFYRAVFYSIGQFSHPPYLRVHGQQSIVEDSDLRIQPTLTDADSTLDSLVLTATSSNTSLIANNNLNFTFENGDWVLTGLPEENQFGKSLIELNAIDPAGNSSSTTFELTVTASNDLPMISAILDQSIGVNQTLGPLNFTINDIETPVSSLLVSVETSNPSLIAVQDIELQGSGSERALLITPQHNQVGSSQITIQVVDEDGAIATESFLVQVRDSEAPTVSPISNRQTNEDTPLSVLFTATDETTPASELTIVGEADDIDLFPSSAFVFSGVGEQKLLQLTPASDISGNAIIAITVSDASGNSTQVEFSVSVAPVNDAPNFELATTHVADEDAAVQSTSLTSISPGPSETQPLAFDVQTANPELFEVLEVNHFDSSTTGMLRWQPAPNVHGSTSVLVRLTDGGLDGNLNTPEDNLFTESVVSITINSINDTPTLVLPFASIEENQTGSTLGTAAVDDPDHEAHTFSLSDERFEITEEELRVAPGVSFDFETEPLISLEVTVSDAEGASSTASTRITVRDVNELPESLSLETYVLYQEVFEQELGMLVVRDPDAGQQHSIESLDTRFEIANGRIRLAPGQSIPAGQDEPIEVQLRATDDGSPPLANEFVLSLTATAVDSPWKNQLAHLDVNQDGFVSPIDALLVINFLNTHSAAQLSAADFPPLASGPLVDVSGDRFATPLDALLVINSLNTGEGEAYAEAPMPFELEDSLASPKKNRWLRDQALAELFS